MRSRRALFTPGLLVLATVSLVACGGEESKVVTETVHQQSTSTETETAEEAPPAEEAANAPTLAPTRKPAVAECMYVTRGGGGWQRLKLLKGTTCAEAWRVWAAYERSWDLPRGWQCFLAHDDPSRAGSCGLNPTGGDVRNAERAIDVFQSQAPDVAPRNAVATSAIKQQLLQALGGQGSLDKGTYLATYGGVQWALANADRMPDGPPLIVRPPGGTWQVVDDNGYCHIPVELARLWGYVDEQTRPPCTD